MVSVTSFVTDRSHSSRRCGATTISSSAAWLLVQIDPYIVEKLAFSTGLGALARPRCAVPAERGRARIDMLGQWLFDAIHGSTSGAAVERIVELLLLAVAEVPTDEDGLDAASPAHPERLFQALERLRTAPDQPLTLDCAASLCSLSPTYFSRRFRQLFGMTFSTYARTYRLHLAARRLLATGQSVSEICFSVGFTSPAHFSARFRERFGMTPREYRAKARLQRCAGEGSS